MKRKKFKRKLQKFINEERFKEIYIGGKLTNYMISSRGYVINYNFQDSGKPRILKEETNHGYKRVTLFFNGKKYHKRIHRLVAEAFVTNPKPKKFNIVHHKDNNKTHNWAENLEWTTNYGNSQYAVADGAIKYGEDHPRANYTNDEIGYVCELLEENLLSIKEISDITNVSPNTIQSVLYKINWKNVSSSYNISNYNINRNNSKLDKELVIKIADLLVENKLSNKEIAAMFNIKPYVVSDIKQKKTYTEITKDYNFPIKRINKKE